MSRELFRVTRTQSKRVINLLPLIYPKLDAVDGTWRIERGMLMPSGSGQERLQIPYEPPAEYDYRVTFIKPRDGIVVQMMSKGGKPFIFVRSPQKFIFHYLTSGNLFDNRTGAQNPAGFAPNVRHVCTVSVRNNGVTATLDGVVVDRWNTDYTDINVQPYWALNNRALLGVGAGDSKLAFEAIEVVEVTGEGKNIPRETP